MSRYKLLHEAFVRKQYFLPLSQSPIAMTSGRDQFLILHHWCQVWLPCRTSNSLLERLETVLEPIALPYKRKIARMVLLFFTLCFIDRCSLPCTTRPFLVIKRVIALNLTIALCTAVLEHFLCILIRVKQLFVSFELLSKTTFYPLNGCKDKWPKHFD